MVRRFFEDRADFLVGVAEGGLGTGGHEPGLLEHLLAGVVHEEVVGKVGDERHAEAENDNQDEIELGEQLHGSLLNRKR